MNSYQISESRHYADKLFAASPSVRLTAFCEIWILGNCKIKNPWIFEIKNLDFTKSTFLITFIKLGFCEINKSGF